MKKWLVALLLIPVMSVGCEKKVYNSYAPLTPTTGKAYLWSEESMAVNVTRTDGDMLPLPFTITPATVELEVGTYVATFSPVGAEEVAVPFAIEGGQTVVVRPN